MSQLLLIPGWQAFDLSTRYQAERGVKVYSLIPDAAVFSNFSEMHDPSRSGIRAVKLRVYARDMGDMWSVRLVPISMLSCLSEESITQSITLWLARHGKSINSLGIISSSCQYRLLSYVISHSLYSHFIDSAISRMGNSIPHIIRGDLMDMSYGPGFFDLISDALNNSGELILPSCVGEPSPPFADKYDFSEIRCNNSIGLSAAMREAFTWLYRTREMGARKIVREQGLDAIDSAEYIQLDRLLYGFSPASLISRIHSEDYNVDRLLSLLIDKYVDMGIAVPTNVCDGGTVYRAFRHGEDAVYGEAEERLTIIALKSFLDALSRDGVWGLELQKFIVLFVQIALRNSLLDRVDTSESVNVGCKVVSIKGHLHGPVPVIQELDPSGDLGPPFLEGPDSHPMWLVEHWVRNGILQENRTDRGKHYSISRIPDLSIGDRPEAAARAIGRTLAYGMLLPPELMPIDHNHDLVMLSTCAEPDHQARALSAEIQIFRERWPSIIKRVREASHAQQYDKARRDLRSVNAVFTAVNSGAMKYRWYSDKTFKGRIEEVRSALTQSGKDDAADSWRQMWPETLSRDRSNTPTELHENIEACGGWLVTAVFSFLAIEMWLLRKGKELGQCTDAEMDTALKEIAFWSDEVLTRTSSDHFTQQHALARDIKVHSIDATMETLARWSKTGADHLEELCKSKALLLTEETTLLLSTFAKAKAPIQVYPYALYLDLPGEAEKSFTTAVRIVEQAVQQVDTPYLILPFHQNPWRRGVWLLLSGNRKSNRLCRAAKRVSESLHADAHAFRMVLIGQLSHINSIRCKPGSPALAYGNFFRRVADLKEHILPSEYGNLVSVVSMTSLDGDTEISKLIKETDWRSGESQVVQSVGDGLSMESYDIATAIALPRTKAPGMFEGCDVGILTVLPTEATAVRSIIAFDVKDVLGPTTKRNYDIGRLSYGKRSIKVVHCQMRDAGTNAAMATFIDLVAEARPRLVCVVGIAGGISNSISDSVNCFV